MTGIQVSLKLDWPNFKLDVDLDLPSHGITALFGSSGSGKTTLLRCIAGLERATGQLVINGEIWQNEHRFLATHKRALGYVFQEASLFAHLSVLGNLRYGLKRIPAKQQVNLEQAIELLGIAHLLERKPERLSGGERSRVGIARALALSPNILLMDEPLAALDVKRKQEILPYLERLHEALNIPVLYISHSPDEVARLADHLVVMENGRVLASGPLAETLTRLDLPIYLGEDAGAILDVSVTELDPEWHLARVSFSGGSLWARDQDLPIGRKLRVRVLARDVSLAIELPSKSSIQNILQGRVDALSDDEHPGLVLVRVQVGDAMILARLTKKSAAALDIRPGLQVWAQIKSVALME